MNELPIGALAITPFALRGLVRITALAGVLDGKQAVEVEYVGDHPHGYPEGSIGCYFVHDLAMVGDSDDSFCRVCGWTGHHSDLLCHEECHCPKCYVTNIGHIPFEAFNHPEGWVPF